jgi:hypothetical protein
MVSNLDVWRTADLVYKQYRDNAQLHAARRVSELTNAGDQAGALVWSDILAAIAVMSTWENPDSLPRN